MTIKRIASKNYNLVFDDSTGFTARWGATKDEDPPMCPLGPEILDIEISTCCFGIGKDMDSRRPCSWCLPGDQKINMADGSQKPIRDVLIGDVVLGGDGAAKTAQTVKELYARDYRGKIVEITLEDGRALRMTPNHPVMVKDRTWKLAGDLKEGDEVITV